MKSAWKAVRSVMDVNVLAALHAIRSRGDSSVLGAVVRGKVNLHYPTGAAADHLQAAVEWLCRAQDAVPGGGVSGAFDIIANSWYAPYPETTGYIIPTFFDYAAYSGKAVYRERAMRMANWLLPLQLEDGAFPSPPWIEPAGAPMVFDTGQIVQGMVRTFTESADPRFLEAARRACDWLVGVQEADGSWRAWDMGYPHTYNARSAWAMLQLEQIDPCEPLRVSARNFLEWVCRHQDADGWFHHAAFSPQEEPLTHTIAYTIEGLLESGRLLGDNTLIRAARLAADALIGRQESDGGLRSRYGAGWQPASRWSCLTGNAQMAMIWFHLYEMTGEGKYLQAAVAANRFLKRLHARSSSNLGVRGGVSGSFPIYGDYGHYLYLNWAVKFFADSLLLEERLLQQPKNESPRSR